ncbi:MAG: hypothetical protein V3T72_09625 [Thermoanaerobaculia bacterium]
MKRRFVRLVLAVVAVLVQAGCDADRRPIADFESDAPSALFYPRHETLELRFRPTAFPLTGGCPTVFLHLQDASGRVVRTFDHRPPRWMPGEEVSYRLELFQSALAPPLPAGVYRLVAGLYDPASGRRSRLQTNFPEAGDARYVIASIEVEETVADNVQLDFSPDWQDPEPGSDAQILARRWFAGTAKLEITAGSEAIVLWLQVAVPRTAAADLVLEAGARQPRVAVTVSCADDPPSWGVGRHQLEVEIAAGKRCEIGFRANFSQRSEEGPRSAALEAISWSRE